MSDRLIFALHGFLGRPQDFSFCASDYSSFRALDYLQQPKLSPENSSLGTWGENFWSTHTSLKPVDLVGYSLGGRLALSAAQAGPEKVDRLALLAAQFYFPEDEKPARKIWDEKWAQRFLGSEDFQTIMQDWNLLPIFKGSQAEPQRSESDYDRKILAEILTRWSPAKQDDYTDFLRQRTKPTLFLYGEYDQGYKKLSQRLHGSSVIVMEIPKAGHRLWCDQPEIVRHILKDFLS
jgi:2-succinyl-6-hydroxy-2,4-cyclohexadiene-1-carboxylate synthase